MTATLSPRGVANRLAAGQDAELIDVRTPVEFREVHAEQARNVPLDRLDPAAWQGRPADQPLFVICRSGNRSRQACQRLAAAGLPVVNVEGGTQAWEAAGLSVVRGQKAISLERQVRIVAGGLAFVGAVLALTVHPYFAGIPAFIGAGLVFAGITDTCGMGLILARMPWNQVAATSSAVCKT
jgi:rhodanese-related sulfurtransferase